MNVGLFGGTFDPVHRGHIALAQTAMESCKLHRVYFVAASIPPHKLRQPLAPYAHRFAMLALGTVEEKAFVPSLLEAPEIIRAEGKLASYSVDTVRRFRQRLGKRDKLFFLIGIDAFLEIDSWRDPVELLRECEFIVASRPGFSLADAAMALPKEMRPKENVARLFKDREASGPLLLSGASIHFLDGVHEPESSTDARQVASSGRKLERLLAPPVAEYIRKMRLYRNETEPGSPELPAPSSQQKAQPAGKGPRLLHGRKR